MATYRQAFIRQAWAWRGVKEKGKNSYEKGSELEKIFKLAGISKGTAWCAAFVVACGKRAKIVGKGKLMGNNSYAAGVCHTVISHGGKWIKGPYVTKTKVKPQPGDLILFNDSGCHMKYNTNGTVKAWHGTHVGIVCKVTKTRVVTVEGNSGDKTDGVYKHEYKFNAHKIAGYARPDWVKMGDPAGGDADPLDPLYDSENDRHDMTMREIGYMNSSGKLTTSNTGVRIALINYTTLLGDLYDMFVRSTYGNKQVDTSKLKGNVKITVDALMALGLNAAAACGVAGNIAVDSNFNPAAVSPDGKLVGLCKWSGVEATKMKTNVGMTSWATDLSGQVDYIFNDVLDNYNDLMRSLRKVEVSSKGAKEAAKLFANAYRKITATKSVEARQSMATGYFSAILITPPKQAGTTPNPTVPPAKGKDKVINTAKKQQQILSVCYEYYTGSGVDAAVQKEWKKKGSPSSKGVAYIAGNYLVAVASGLGMKINEVITLHLTSGATVPCLVAGVTKANNTILQFYQVPNTSIDLRRFSQQKIVKIVDHGKRK